MIIWSLCRLDQKGLLCSYLFPFRSIVANEQTTTVNIRTYIIYKDILIPSLSKSTETYHRKDWGAGTGTGICIVTPWYFFVTVYGPILLYISEGPRNWCSVTLFITRMLSLHIICKQWADSFWRVLHGFASSFFRIYGNEVQMGMVHSCSDCWERYDILHIYMCVYIYMYTYT